VDLRRIVNATLYLTITGWTITGCQWRYLPKEYKEYPAWQNVFYDFDKWRRKWRRDGTWLEIHERLRCQVRQKGGAKAEERGEAQAVGGRVQHLFGGGWSF